MFGFKKKQQIEQYEQRVIDLEEKVKLLQEAVNDKVAGYKVTVDLKAMKAFSVERLYRVEENIMVTIIGYYNLSNALSQWLLRCDDEQHIALVEEFNELKRKSIINYKPHEQS